MGFRIFWKWKTYSGEGGSRIIKALTAQGNVFSPTLFSVSVGDTFTNIPDGVKQHIETGEVRSRLVYRSKVYGSAAESVQRRAQKLPQMQDKYLGDWGGNCWLKLTSRLPPGFSSYKGRSTDEWRQRQYTKWQFWVDTGMFGQVFLSTWEPDNIP